MQCSQLQQIIPNSQFEGGLSTCKLVSGICDYIPCSLKNQSSLTINITGDYRSILNSVLWSEFFTKTLIKECQHHMLMQSYISEGQTKEHPIFLKTKGKIFKLSDSLNWECEARKYLEASFESKGELTLESFSHTGKTKSIVITFGQYSQKGEVDLVLKLPPHTRSIKTNQMSQSKVPSQSQSHSNLASHKKRAKSSTTNLKKMFGSTNFNTSKVREDVKMSAMTQMSLKQKIQNHYNNKKSSSKNKENKQTVQSSKKSEKNENKTKSIALSSQNTYEHPSSRILMQTLKSNKVSNIFSTTEQVTQARISNSREIVLSKILSSKEQMIISLKEQLIKQENQYLSLLEEEKNSRREETDSLSQNIKTVLSQYQQIQKEKNEENNYLKERIKVLQQVLQKKQSEAQNFCNQKQSMIKVKREQENTIKTLNQSFRVYKQQNEAEIKVLQNQNKRHMQEFQKLMEKCNMYQTKYQNLVSVMKKSIPIDE